MYMTGHDVLRTKNNFVQRAQSLGNWIKAVIQMQYKHGNLVNLLKVFTFSDGNMAHNYVNRQQIMTLILSVHSRYKSHAYISLKTKCWFIFSTGDVNGMKSRTKCNCVYFMQPLIIDQVWSVSMIRAEYL